jgi:hypothetical protein
LHNAICNFLLVKEGLLTRERIRGKEETEKRGRERKT